MRAPQPSIAPALSLPWCHLLMVLCALVGACAGGPLHGQCDPTTDCNNNGVLDSCDISLGTADDCNANGIPDACDISTGASDDCNFNQIPDECEPPGLHTLVPSTPFASVDAVSLRGNVAAVGSTADTFLGVDAGCAQVFRRVGTIWSEEGTTLRASDGGPGDRFGSSISIDGNMLAVGAPGVDSNALVDVGAVYVFRRTPGVGWTQSAKLSLQPPLNLEGFGSSVMIRGNRLIAGASQTASGGTGRALIFTFDGFSWSIEASLSPATLSAGDEFGASVSLGVSHAYVGAPNHGAGGTPGAGAVFAYSLTGTWGLQATLTAPVEESGARFGTAISGTDLYLAAGAPGSDLGDGSAHLFSLSSGSWAHADTFLPEAASPGTAFGHALALSAVNQRLVIAEREDTGAGRLTSLRNNSGSWISEGVTELGIPGDGAISALGGDGVYALMASSGVPSARIAWVAPISDCNLNGIDDACDIAQGGAVDCNLNGIPDDCDISVGSSVDCDGNLVPDDCQLGDNPNLDCNLNGLLDSCDLAAGTSLDCNGNGIPDDCDIASGADSDCLGDGIPDSCQGLSDTTPPQISGVSPTVTASTDVGICGAIVSWPAPVIVDDCSLASSTITHESGTLFLLGPTTVGITATDAAGNQSSTTFDVIVVDDLPPVITALPVDVTIEASAQTCSAPITWTPPTASDGCGLVSFTSNYPNGAHRPVGVTAVVYTATDVHGNISTASFDVTVVDTTAPTFGSVPADRTLVLDAGACGATATWSAPSITDNCAGASFIASHASGILFPTGTTTVTFDGVDASGNTASASFEVTVIDTEGPVISGLPADLTLSPDPGSCEAAASWTPPTAADPCGVGSFTSSHDPGVVFGVGVHTVTYTASDSSANTTTASFIVEVLDTELPVFVSPVADLTLTLSSSSCSEIATWTPPTATDNCGVATMASSHSPGNPFPIGTTAVTYTATDVNGNAATSSFTVTVLDAQSPTIPDLPTLLLSPADPGECGAIVEWVAPVGADNCGVAAVTSTHQPGELFPVGDTLVAVTVTDTSGNVATGAFVVFVFDDEDPVITGLPAEMTVSVDPGACDAVVTWPEPTYSDNCALATASSSIPNGSTLPVGTTTVTFLALDTAGNSTSVDMAIEVIDDAPPTLATVPADQSFVADLADCSFTATWTPPTAEDGCGIASLESTHQPGETFTAGDTVVTYTATDNSGNVTTASFTISVIDNLPPILIPGPDISVAADPGLCGAAVTVPLPFASDSCGDPIVTNSFNGGTDASGIYPVGLTTIVWSATDSSGNISNLIQRVTVTLSVAADCNGNGIDDLCDLQAGTSSDCNGNGIPDECDIDSGLESDCDGNGSLDSCDLAAGGADCNENGILDSCDLASGASVDGDGDGAPDECQAAFIRGDANIDGGVDIADSIFILSSLFSGGAAPSCADAADVNDDGFIDVSDVVYGIAFIFSGGAAPPAPYPACGVDGTPGDSLGCDSNSSCN
jgi:hypothetical protein